MMFDDFMIRAALAGAGAALAAAPLGCFVLWRRMAYFGDAISHGALLGVALAAVFSLPVTPIVLVVASAMGLATLYFSRQRYSMDAMLGVFSYGALACGLVMMMRQQPMQMNLESALFGDVLLVNIADLWLIWAVALGVLVVVRLFWRHLINATLNEDLTWAEGRNPVYGHFLLTLLIALVVAVSLKLIGALMIGALMILPAAAARPLARSPEAMVCWAIGIGISGSVLGVYASEPLMTASGPTVVLGLFLVFIVNNILVKAVFNRLHR